MKRLIFTLLVMALVTGCSSDDMLNDIQNNTKNKADNVYDLQKSKMEAMSLADNLNSSFESSITKSSNTVYPNYYGGNYINEEGRLVVLTVGDTIEFMNRIKTRVISDNFELEPCLYSYNYLLTTINNLNIFFDTIEGKKMLQELSISAFGLLDNKNQVFVDIKDLNSDKINQFKNKIMDTPAIIFRNTDFECSTHLASDIHPGGPLYTTSTVNNNKGGSFGYRVKSRSTGAQGFVTCAHVMKTQTAPVYYGLAEKIQIGNCVKLINNGDLDGAFCQVTNNGFTLSNQAAFGAQLSTSIQTLSVGADVLMDGRTTNRRAWGVVQATNVSVSFKDKETGLYTPLYKGLTQTDYECQEGDSGGVVYSTSYKTVGMHEGGGYSTFTYKYIGYYWPASTVNSKLGVTRY